MPQQAPHRITFPGSQGDALAARLDLPVDEPRGFAVFAHCFTCGKDLNAAGVLARALTSRGIGVLRFDFTGLGHSEGEFANTNFSSNVEDLVAAVDWLGREHEAPKLLVGHSLGGAAVLQAAARLESVGAVATIGAPSDPSYVTGLFEDDLDRIEASGAARVRLAGRPFTITRQFVDDVREQRLFETVASLRPPLLVFHAPEDELVELRHAQRLFEAAREPKSLVSLDGADHLLSRGEDARYAGQILAAWADRYFPPTPPRPERDEHQVVVETARTGRFTNVVRTGSHALLADEPRSFGGDDLGPAPYEYLLAGLGACTTMTLRMYADRKGWPLEAVSVSLRRELDRAAAERGEPRERFTKEVLIEGALDREQRDRLLEISARCPVHRTLLSDVEIETVEILPASDLPGAG